MSFPIAKDIIILNKIILLTNLEGLTLVKKGKENQYTITTFMSHTDSQ